MHKLTTFQMTAYAVCSDGFERTVVTNGLQEAGRVTSSDFRAELPARAIRFAAESVDRMRDLAFASRTTLDSVKVAIAPAIGFDAPDGFIEWEKLHQLARLVPPPVFA